MLKIEDEIREILMIEELEERLGFSVSCYEDGLEFLQRLCDEIENKQ